MLRKICVKIKRKKQEQYTAIYSMNCQYRLFTNPSRITVVFYHVWEGISSGETGGI
jgi:hypothetical protein